MNLKSFLFMLLSVMLLVACRAPQISYYQDAEDGLSVALSENGLVKLRPMDEVVVVVNAKDQQYANLLNLPYSASRIGLSAATAKVSSQSQGVMSYKVDSDGCVDFPLLGKVKAAGLSREEFAAKIKQELLDRKIVPDDPLVVTVEFTNLTVSVLGEVKNPGKYSITKDKMTILEAISMAGDMSIYGERDEVVVLREEDGKQKTYIVDLTSVKKLLDSPVYYMQQNDIVYVKPNSMRQRQATVSGNTVYTPSFWISVASLLTTITALIINN
jgi:polysaccharide export outer membrane protein